MIMYVCMYVCMSLCMYVYVCVYVCMYVYVCRPGELFYDARERLRDLLRQCLHHGISKHEIT